MLEINGICNKKKKKQHFLLGLSTLSSHITMYRNMLHYHHISPCIGTCYTIITYHHVSEHVTLSSHITMYRKRLLYHHKTLCIGTSYTKSYIIKLHRVSEHVTLSSHNSIYRNMLHYHHIIPFIATCYTKILPVLGETRPARVEVACCTYFPTICSI